MKTQPSQRNFSAFTLIELVISAALAAMILVGAYMCLSAGFASQKLIEPRTEVIQNARVAMAMMSADLRSACPLSKDFDFLGMNRMLGEVEADNLDFATHNYAPRRPGEGDFCQVSFFLEKDEKTGKYNLWRRRNPTIALDPLAGGKREEIAQDLRGLRFEYYDGYDWYDTWGDIEGRSKKKEVSPQDEPNLFGMPEAVRITLWFDPDSKSVSEIKTNSTDSTGSALVFQTVTRINLAASSQPTASESRKSFQQTASGETN